MKYIKQRISKDGLKGPIEEADEPRVMEEHVLFKTIGTTSTELDYPSPPHSSRKYRLVRQVPCVLLVMEEE